MATEVQEYNFTEQGGDWVKTAWETFAGSTTGVTDWVAFRKGDVAFAIGGSATNVTGTVQRSAAPPDNLEIPVIADTAGFSGNASTGINPDTYEEAGVGWWRVEILTNNGSVTVSLTGTGRKSI